MDWCNIRSCARWKVNNPMASKDRCAEHNFINNNLRLNSTWLIDHPRWMQLADKRIRFVQCKSQMYRWVYRFHPSLPNRRAQPTSVPRWTRPLPASISVPSLASSSARVPPARWMRPWTAPQQCPCWQSWCCWSPPRTPRSPKASSAKRRSSSRRRSYRRRSFGPIT